MACALTFCDWLNPPTTLNLTLTLTLTLTLSVTLTWISLFSSRFDVLTNCKRSSGARVRVRVRVRVRPTQQWW